MSVPAKRKASGPARGTVCPPLGLDRPIELRDKTPGWGSDVVAQAVRQLEIPFIALNPGASYRGLHDSLVNFLGNERPEMLLCAHEEHAVAIAQGYAKATGEPLLVALHSNVGLMHGSMALFNAWCDRVPMIVLGATGPVDAAKRRPWIDWIHTSRDQASMVRHFTKWDDQPASLEAAIEALLRGNLLTRTAPRGPVYICLDAELQEKALERAPALPELRRFAPPSPAQPEATASAAAAALLVGAKRPAILLGRSSLELADWEARVELAERLGAVVLTDLKNRAAFPTDHPLHPLPPFNVAPAAAREILREADVILSLDWVDLAGVLKLSFGKEAVGAKVIQASLDFHGHNGWSMDHQGLPPADIFLQCEADQAVAALLALLPEHRAPRPALAAVGAAMRESRPANDEGSIPLREVGRVLKEVVGDGAVTFPCLARGWPLELWPFHEPLDYLGKDGGGGVGSGPGISIGAGLALRAHPERLVISVIGDGDLMMSPSALWTAAHYRIPVMILVANNQSYFNDEIHQENVARHRNRSEVNGWIGQRMVDPDPDLAKLAEAQGVAGIGPVTRREELQPALVKALGILCAGRPVLVDVRIARGRERHAAGAVQDRGGA